MKILKTSKSTHLTEVSAIAAQKNEVSCRFGHIYWKILNGKHQFFCSVITQTLFRYSGDRIGIIHLVITQNFSKNYHFLLLDICAHQGVRNFSFFENYIPVLTEWSHIPLNLILPKTSLLHAINLRKT